MPTSSPLLKWLNHPPAGWRFHLLVTLITAGVFAGALYTRYHLLAGMPSSTHYIIWCVTPVIMMMYLLWGQRVFWGVFAGSLIGLSSWFSPLLVFVAALDAAIQPALGVWIMRRFWPQSMPPQPGVRFFSVLIGLGVILPVSVLSLPIVLVFRDEMYFVGDYWNAYIEWCVSELAGVLILLPALMLWLYPSFRKTIQHARELALYIPLGIMLMVGCVLYAQATDSQQIIPVESWLIVGIAGFIMVIRNGVGGVIIANLIMAFATIIVQTILASSGAEWLTHRMLVEFNIYTCHLTGFTLIIAAGFYDHQMLRTVTRSITAQILNTQINERRRLAADLHDSVSQEFAAALMYLNVGLSPEPENVRRDNILLAQSCLAKGLKDLRQTAAGLRPELLEHGAFADVIESYCVTFEERHNIDVLFVSEIPANGKKLPLEKREHAFRIIQEALNNAVRHGKAQSITVSLAYDEKRDGIIIAIEDDGAGFDPQEVDTMNDRPHLGLRLMQERAILMGGTFSIASVPGVGTAIQLSIPLHDAA